MELLKQRILKDGTVKMPNIVKVDSFLNHQIDIDLLDEIGKEFYRRFEKYGITKIVTIEASGIAIACSAARYFNVPVVFAKKHENKNMDADVYQVTIHSFTKDKDYVAKISKRYLDSSDRVLIIDDFLANGEAAKGLVSMVGMSGAEIAGIGIVIEKGFQNGGKALREKGLKVESLAIIENIKDDEVIFKESGRK
ncbi:MAG: xanthine phosphoribosyltransferase [Bacillota bacterium]|nr:xanthine phosphoribosyltransferase [Bacillota bacterium]